MRWLIFEQNRKMSLRLGKIKGMMSKQSWIVQYMSKKQTAKCQASTSLFCGKLVSKGENSREPLFAVLQLLKLIISFHKNCLEKLTVIFPPINSAFLMTRLIVLKKQLKQKRYYPMNKANKIDRNWGFIVMLWT